MFIDFGADVMTGAAKRSRTPPEFIAKVHDGTQEVEQRQVCPSCARMRRNICGRGIWASGCGERGPLCYCRRKNFLGRATAADFCTLAVLCVSLPCHDADQLDLEPVARAFGMSWGACQGAGGEDYPGSAVVVAAKSTTTSRLCREVT